MNVRFLPALLVGLALHAGSGAPAPDRNEITGDLTKFELTTLEAGKGPELSEAEVAKLGESVRKGGSLLLTLGEKPGRLPMRLAFLLPTTGWMTSGAQTARTEASVAEADPASSPRARWRG